MRVDDDALNDECLLLIPVYVVEGVEAWRLVYDAATDTARIVFELIDGRTLGPNTDRVVLKRAEYPVEEATGLLVPDFFWELVPGQLAKRRSEEPKTEPR